MGYPLFHFGSRSLQRLKMRMRQNNAGWVLWTSVQENGRLVVGIRMCGPRRLGTPDRATTGLQRHDRAAPGQAAAEGDEQDGVARLAAAGSERLVERDWHAGRGGVAVLVEVHHHLV